MKSIKKLKKIVTYELILKIFLVFVLIQPIFDIVSNLANYNYIKLNLVTYIKPSVILIIQIILFLKNKFKNNIKYYIYYFFILIYIILHSFLLLKINVDTNVIIHEIRFIINICYFIMVYMILKQLYKNIDDKKEFYRKLKNTLIYTLLLYIGLYLISVITNTSWLTYEFSDDSKMGLRGWYYSGQIFGHLISICLPIMIFNIFNSKINNILKYILLIIITIPYLLIGTKVAYFILIIVYIIYILLSIFFRVRDKKEFKISNISLCLFIIIVSVLLYKYLPVYNNININKSVLNNSSFLEVTNNSINNDKNNNPNKNGYSNNNGNPKPNEENNNDVDVQINKPEKNENINKETKEGLALKYEQWIKKSLDHLNELYTTGKLHSTDNRNRQFHYMHHLFSISDFQFKLLGIGYLNHPNYLSIERDIIMPLYCFGIIGAIIFLYIIISLLFKMTYIILKNIKVVDKETLIIACSFCMFLFISLFAGATYIYTQFSIILAIIMILLVYKLNSINKITDNKNIQVYLSKIYSKSKQEYYDLMKNTLILEEKRFVITANPETLTKAEKDEEISKMLLDNNNSIIPDGIAIVKACKILDIKVTERIAGIDVAEYLLKECNEQKKSIYLFGAKPEVIKAMVTKIDIDYPNIKLLGYSDGYVKDRDKVFKKIVELKPDVCFVALGIPYQEKIIYKYLDKFEKGIFVGVGGSFDVISGTKKRAPKIFIKLNLEWLYRIISEPKRLKRFWDSNVKFIFKVRKYK